jgi:hypothetical protein
MDETRFEVKEGMSGCSEMRGIWEGVLFICDACPAEVSILACCIRRFGVYLQQKTQSDSFVFIWHRNLVLVRSLTGRASTSDLRRWPLGLNELTFGLGYLRNRLLVG